MGHNRVLWTWVALGTHGQTKLSDSPLVRPDTLPRPAITVLQLKTGGRQPNTEYLFSWWIVVSISPVTRAQVSLLPGLATPTLILGGGKAAS